MVHGSATVSSDILSATHARDPLCDARPRRTFQLRSPPRSPRAPSLSPSPPLSRCPAVRSPMEGNSPPRSACAPLLSPPPVCLAAQSRPLSVHAQNLPTAPRVRAVHGSHPEYTRPSLHGSRQLAEPSNCASRPHRPWKPPVIYAPPPSNCAQIPPWQPPRMDTVGEGILRLGGGMHPP
jgi:hypothetical protein